MPDPIRSSSLNSRSLVLALAGVLTLIALPLQAQTFSVLYSFMGGADGGNPYAGLTYDSTGLFYGTAYDWGNIACMNGCGVVFELRERNSQWSVSPLYDFNGVSGANPTAGITEFNGIPFGTTYSGGSAGNGTVFELRPQPTPCRTSRCYWNDTVLHSFTGGLDGSNPNYGNVIFDRSGNMYGTAADGGSEGCGTVWELSRSGGGWTQTTLYTFGQTADDACVPLSGVIFDSAGNLYGTTAGGGTGSVGTVYELSPQNGVWTEKILVNFTPELGDRPYGTPVMDSSGNLFGTTKTGGPLSGGTVFELSPANGGWTFSQVYAFGSGMINSCYPNAGVTLGPDGNLYGACTTHGLLPGWIFKMPPDCNQTCSPTDLHDFNSSDGSNPTGAVTFDPNGNLYGTAFYGGYTGYPCGAYGCGVIWEIAGAADVPRH